MYRTPINYEEFTLKCLLVTLVDFIANIKFAKEYSFYKKFDESSLVNKVNVKIEKKITFGCLRKPVKYLVEDAAYLYKILVNIWSSFMENIFFSSFKFG